MIIGSLYWDKKDVRINWRNNRLTDEKFDVLAPIRYGRLSKSRGNTYTMVFSRLCIRKCYGLGCAKVVTCKNEMNNIENVIEEAKFLWAAESNTSQLKNNFCASWGAVGLLCNPKTSFPKDFFSNWTKITSSSNKYGKISHAKSEKPVLNKSGFLNIPWPILLDKGKPLPVDILLATATDPTLCMKSSGYPKAKEIAEAWKNDSQGHDEYFWNNIDNGIQTFQDKNIKKLLK